MPSAKRVACDCRPQFVVIKVADRNCQARAWTVRRARVQQIPERHFRDAVATRFAHAYTVSYIPPEYCWRPIHNS